MTETGNLTMAFYRRSEFTVQIGDDITVTVYPYGSNQCKMSVKAPRHLNISRKEEKNVAKREGEEGHSDRLLPTNGLVGDRSSRHKPNAEGY